jgi:hypothetical protein
VSIFCLLVVWLVVELVKLFYCKHGCHNVPEEFTFLGKGGVRYCKTHGKRVALHPVSGVSGYAPILHMPKLLRRLAVDYVPNGGDPRCGVLGLCSKPSKSCSYRFVVVNQELVGKERVALLCLSDSVCGVE